MNLKPRSLASNSRRRPLTLVALFCVACTHQVEPATLDIPSVSATIQSPDGHQFVGMQLGINWFCVEDSYFLMNPTGEKDCGGLGAKSGLQMIDVAADGSFQTSPIKVTRISLTRNPRFYLRFGFFEKGERLPDRRSPKYTRRYISTRDGEVREKFVADLSDLRLIRARGGRLTVRVAARESGEDESNFNNLMDKYPDSYNYSSRLILWINATPGSESKAMALDIHESVVEIPDFEFVQVGSNDEISVTALIEARVGLVKEPGQYKYYSEEARLKGLFLEVNRDLEIQIPASFLNGVDVVVDID